jgi:hypothetical protein
VTTSRQYAHCPVCGACVAITAHGTLARHRVITKASYPCLDHTTWCPWSHRPSSDRPADVWAVHAERRIVPRQGWQP